MADHGACNTLPLQGSYLTGDPKESETEKPPQAEVRGVNRTQLIELLLVIALAGLIALAIVLQT
jgi:hypothetical protein